MFADGILIWWIFPIIFMIGFLHSSVGMAGGTVYSAFLSILGVPNTLVPSISLSINTFNSSVGSFHFIRQGHFYLRILWPFLLGSLPGTLIGASITLPEPLFQILLFATLVFTLLRMAVFKQDAFTLKLPEKYQMILSILIGFALGLLSGSLGIGGGIYLIPILLMLGLASLQESAAAGVVFILCNSCVGLLSRGISASFNIDSIAIIVVALTGAYLGAQFGSQLKNKDKIYFCLYCTLSIGAVLLLGKITSGWLI
jgi:uncharacterized membrane protein YfcA